MQSSSLGNNCINIKKNTILIQILYFWYYTYLYFWCGNRSAFIKFVKRCMTSTLLQDILCAFSHMEIAI